MVNKTLCPSLMCADLGNLRQAVSEMDAAGINEYHMDIMDGEFVPNFALSWVDFATVKKLTKKALDCHLMVKNPAIHLPYAFKYGANLIYIHYEAGSAANYLYEIKSHGAKAGLAINPETRVEDIETLFPLLDSILVMRVHPGFAGQVAIPEVEDKIQELASIPNRKFSIRLDGHVSQDVIKKWSEQGVEGFVLGTASQVFKKDGKIDLIELRKIIKDLRGTPSKISDKHSESKRLRNSRAERGELNI